jgi:hypothetical protein
VLAELVKVELGATSLSVALSDPLVELEATSLSPVPADPVVELGDVPSVEVDFPDSVVEVFVDWYQSPHVVVELVVASSTGLLLLVKL